MSIPHMNCKKLMWGLLVGSMLGYLGENEYICINVLDIIKPNASKHPHTIIQIKTNNTYTLS